MTVRVVRVLLIGGLMLAAAAACGGKPPAAPAPLPSELVAMKASCEALGQAYNQRMAPFAEALTGMVHDRSGDKGAQQALRDLATAIRATTAASSDADMRSDGERAADALTAKAADQKFFADIKTSTDAENVLGPALKDWLAPVTRHCS